MKVSEWDLFFPPLPTAAVARGRENASARIRPSSSPLVSWARFRETTKKQKKKGGGRENDRTKMMMSMLLSPPLPSPYLHHPTTFLLALLFFPEVHFPPPPPRSHFHHLPALLLYRRRGAFFYVWAPSSPPPRLFFGSLSRSLSRSHVSVSAVGSRAERERPERNKCPPLHIRIGERGGESVVCACPKPCVPKGRLW